jgi:FAD/FMN-containing dehydrogenase
MTAAVINDVTGLNPIEVAGVVTPRSVDQVVQAVQGTRGPISIGGGRFSMGGQTASPGALQLDMRGMNRVLAFYPTDRRIRVEAGIRWCDLQRFIDPHGLAVKIMQTYANFTVGGSLSVNVHGRYMGVGPLILSVRWLQLVLADGRIVEATPSENSELFYGAIGGYGALGVIVAAELELVENVRVKRETQRLEVTGYLEFFKNSVRADRDAVFHNADIYPPDFRRLRAVTWRRTLEPATQPRLQQPGGLFPLHKYFLWAMTETPLGKWRRERIVDPLVFRTNPVHWRNFEAGYDAAELEPLSRRHTTYVLQEYFVPIDQFEAFATRMGEILKRHNVNVINISVRHALADPGSVMAWARSECFAFVLYYKQRRRPNAVERVAVWTRELIDAVLDHQGTYYLPYQLHATREQFQRAYPAAERLFELKRRFDPDYRLRNALWDKYNAPRAPIVADVLAAPAHDFEAVYGSTKWRDDFYRFLQNVFNVYPEDRFHWIIAEAAAEGGDEEAVYRRVLTRRSGAAVLLNPLRYALPSLFKQKQEMQRQTLALLDGRKQFAHYVEIGSLGRYASMLRKELRLSQITLVDDRPPDNSPVQVLERGGLKKLGAWVALDHYAPLSTSIPDGSVDLMTCYIGLHHIEPEHLPPFLRSLERVLKPGGLFIVRDHDVTHPEMFRFVSLAHTVFNAGLGEPWSANVAEKRYFRPVADWVSLLGEVGLEDAGARVLQANDPTLNTLMAFRKRASA